MLREATNRVKIEGILAETNIEYGSKEKIVNNKKVLSEYIYGEIKVLVDQEINGEMKTLEIPVKLFSNKYKKDSNTVNPAYTSIEAVAKDFKSIAATGDKNTADKVRITGAKVEMNEYPSRDGDRIISYPQVRASFVNKATGEFNPTATFDIEFAISDMKFVVDKDGVEVEPKKLEVDVIVPKYGAKVDLMKLYAYNPNVIDAIQSYWEREKTFEATGKLNFTSVVEHTTVSKGFGEPTEMSRTTTISELVITGGSQEPEDDERGFNVEELVKAMKERKTYLEERKATKATPAPTSSLSGQDLGF